MPSAATVGNPKLLLCLLYYYLKNSILESLKYLFQLLCLRCGCIFLVIINVIIIGTCPNNVGSKDGGLNAHWLVSLAIPCIVA
ncbi:MAG: hypothetical protein H0A76_05625 [Candidatus Thiodubiliella endoseptemdiera]|uniref:Uncharacterized protein n=1 Tax=Candidatus Thiodubiliella endoseptemdiera TaxID=2738886 RepID=A0A853F1V8_9GAMM|nr:hypothetical protein [Candidatus Thiodubiliella endoseptemdiera]